MNSVSDRLEAQKTNITPGSGDGDGRDNGGMIKLAIMAVGGQGGGVLTNWIESCARRNGYAVQATSVAGVAQRTGATIYYIEMAPQGDQTPIFSLMPAAGDVDILVAAEMMEAGRAIMRGFVTPDRTTLIASSHRALAVSEKTVPGDGIANTDEVLAAADIAARRFLKFDLEQIALECGSVISASLLGALAGSNTLPFTRKQFEETVEISGRNVHASLMAFERAFDIAAGNVPFRASDPSSGPVPGTTDNDLNANRIVHHVPNQHLAAWQELESQVAEFPSQVRDMAEAGLKAVVDFQDIEYGREYLQRLGPIIKLDNRDCGFAFSLATAKYLARAMVYDDVIRVADLKTRRSRVDRVQREIAAPTQTRVMITEFMHPRAEEIVGLLPRVVGQWMLNRSKLVKLTDRLFNRGRRVRSDRLLPFLQLYLIAGLRRWRRGTLRHAQEKDHLEKWLKLALDTLPENYELAVELIRNRRLIKGYSDTHSRGLSKFDRVNGALDLLAKTDDAAGWMARLREAALKDEQGKALDGALKTVRSFADPDLPA